MSVTKITSHVPDAIERLLAQFRDKPRVESLISTGARQIQDLEDSTFALYAGRSLQQATGRALDRYGEMLLETRGLDNDDNYRLRLFFKISKNISNGTPEELIKIILDLMQGDNVQYVEDYPAKITMTVTNTKNVVSLVSVLAQMQQLAPAGVLIKNLAAGYNAAPFAFANHPDLKARGFDTIPSNGNAGQLVSILY